MALKPGASAEPAELQAFVKERVAAYKYPRHVWLVDALPKGPTGKILRRVGRGARGGGAAMSTRPAVAAGLRHRRAARSRRARRASCGRRPSPSAPRWSAGRRPLARDSARDLTARAWHLVNLPAGSDVSRLRAQIGALDREVRRLGLQLEAERRRNADHPHAGSTTEEPMPTVPSPQTVLDRVRRDVERNALRARNGIKLVAGVDRPGVGQTPKDVVWQRGRTQLWHYRNDPETYGGCATARRC